MEMEFVVAAQIAAHTACGHEEQHPGRTVQAVHRESKDSAQSKGNRKGIVVIAVIAGTRRPNEHIKDNAETSALRYATAKGVRQRRHSLTAMPSATDIKQAGKQAA
ncbi:hypothetical protein TgHK011_005529 [Trichoderma gracile]|nr:hypothetical protein TgHK011_005529 [Trichoderma gracile]